MTSAAEGSLIFLSIESMSIVRGLGAAPSPTDLVGSLRCSVKRERNPFEMRQGKRCRCHCRSSSSNTVGGQVSSLGAGRRAVQTSLWQCSALPCSACLQDSSAPIRLTCRLVRGSHAMCNVRLFTTVWISRRLRQGSSVSDGGFCSIRS